MTTAEKIPLSRRPWFAFLSSMRFAVALLCVLAVASMIGTVLQQNQAQADYIVKFGPFWARIFGFLGLYDVYASGWFVVIMLFLVLSTALCLWRNVPPFWREMRSFRLKASKRSLAAMKHSALLDKPLPPEVAVRYFAAQGFAVKRQEREDGSVLVAAKKGAMNKWGYIFAHLAVIVICLGGLIDSNLLLKAGMLAGKIVPDDTAVFARDFKPQSVLGAGNPSFRGNVNISEGQEADVVFLNADKGLLVQQLPFSVKLEKFHIDFYPTGMPSDFASVLAVTDKATGKTEKHTVRVNHPFTLHGVTIYQASFADGGSDVRFKAWDLADGGSSFADLSGRSMNTFPLNMGGKQQYTLELDQFSSMNVEDMERPSEKVSDGLQDKINDVRSVRQDKKFTNIGPSIVYRLRDKAGQAVEFKNYMLPVKQEDGRFFMTGTRTGLEQQYRWLRIPADDKNSPDTFMLWRELIRDETLRRSIAARAAESAPEAMRGQFATAVENTMVLFARGGYLELDRFIQTAVPAAERDKMNGYFYQILYAAAEPVLDEAFKRQGRPPLADEARKRFLLGAMDAYTGLTEYPSPVLLQLDGFKEVRSSGLQMTKSPGASLVYLGSLLLVLGTVFMFYIREKRAWILFDGGQIRFAMSSNRHERDLKQEFPARLSDLRRLSEELET
ncbi:Cytochrome c biogenesis protein CcsB [Kingella potus]|uniref:Cytochrome c biogenesis protein CcsB n=1 Tax=Kingella potus TaxID=265175 RepID=A0A377R1R3_9NEIS|nr:cytochrome c biogenesis protein ResB [Kingella potus]UOP00489.1 cytochrome c biogenesis protein ResB [Kingella potus]STR02436.1 Cytochrome c biogenesis protein CcsB [Kingella potus]